MASILSRPQCVKGLWYPQGLYSLSGGTDILPQDLMKFRSHKIRVWTFPITLKFDRHLGNSAAEMPVKFRSDTIIITSRLMALRFQRFGPKMLYHFVNINTEGDKISVCPTLLPMIQASQEVLYQKLFILWSLTFMAATCFGSFHWIIFCEARYCDDRICNWQL